MSYSELLKATKGKVRWGQHPESSVLLQLQIKQCGMWYTIDGTTTHSLNEAGKFTEMERQAKALGLI